MFHYALNILLLFLIILLLGGIVYYYLKYTQLQKRFLEKDKEIDDKIEEISTQGTMLQMQNRLTEAYAMDLESSRYDLTVALDELDKAHQILNEFNVNLQNEVQKRTSDLQKQNSKILQFAFLNAHKTRAPLARVLGLIKIIQYTKSSILEEDVLNMLMSSANELDSVLYDAQFILSEEESKDKIK